MNNNNNNNNNILVPANFAHLQQQQQQQQPSIKRSYIKRNLVSPNYQQQHQTLNSATSIDLDFDLHYDNNNEMSCNLISTTHKHDSSIENVDEDECIELYNNNNNNLCHIEATINKSQQHQQQNYNNNIFQITNNNNSTPITNNKSFFRYLLKFYTFFGLY
jgi:hypothetical protein